MIKSLSIIQDVHPFKAGVVFNFNPGLNLICGDQGTGKSTLLEAIMQYDQEFAKHVVLEQDHRFRAFAYYSSEYHNPRTVDGGLAIGQTKYSATLEMFYDKIRARLVNSRLANTHHFQIIAAEAFAQCKNLSANVVDKKLVDIDVITRSSMQSHGQALFPFLEEALKVEGGIVFLDEPETSLSIRSQCKLADMLKNAAEKNQIFVATHSDILMRNALRPSEKLLSLDVEYPIWVFAAKFINTQYGVTEPEY